MTWLFIARHPVSGLTGLGKRYVFRNYKTVILHSCRRFACYFQTPRRSLSHSRFFCQADQKQPITKHWIVESVLNDSTIEQVEKSIGYKFRDRHLLRLALVHSSVHYDIQTRDKIVESTKADLQNNERLEFIGDSVLNFLVTEFLFLWFPHLDEGGLSELRASLISRKACEQYFTTLQLAQHLVVKKGFEKLKNTSSVRAGALEAVVGAIYLDGGFQAVRKFVYIKLGTIILDMLSNPPRNYKSMLQEYISTQNKGKVDYFELSCKGPSHEREFVYHARVDHVVLGEGKGVSKKEAQQKAAKEALAHLGVLAKQDELIQQALLKARKRMEESVYNYSKDLSVTNEEESSTTSDYRFIKNTEKPLKCLTHGSDSILQRIINRKYQNLRIIQVSSAIRNLLLQLSQTFDENSVFARESYIRCQLEGIPIANIPAKYGGEDLSIFECIEIIMELSSGCGSTGYGLAHHFATIGFLRDWLITYRCSAAEDMFWDVVLRQCLCYTILSPHIPERNPLCAKASRLANGEILWTIDGIAEEVVASPLLDYFIGVIQFDDSSIDCQTDQKEKNPFAIFLIPKTEAVKLKKITTSQTGFRASGMSSVVFHQVGIHSNNRITKTEHEFSHAALLSRSWHYSCLSAVYIGLAKGALEELMRTMKDVSDGSIRATILQLEMEYFQTKSGLRSVVEGWSQATCVDERMAVCETLEKYYLLLVEQVRCFTRRCYELDPMSSELERFHRDASFELRFERMPVAF
eukprot:jgi/Galph1/2066/GphlegSOOS_G761.1